MAPSRSNNKTFLSSKPSVRPANISIIVRFLLPNQIPIPIQHRSTDLYQSFPSLDHDTGNAPTHSRKQPF